MKKNSPDPADLNTALAATLNGERVRAGLTFAELAKRSGISERTLMRLLSTVERDIDIRVLEVLAEIFHTKGSALLADAEGWRARQEEPTERSRGRQRPSASA